MWGKFVEVLHRTTEIDPFQGGRKKRGGSRFPLRSIKETFAVGNGCLNSIPLDMRSLLRTSIFEPVPRYALAEKRVRRPQHELCGWWQGGTGQGATASRSLEQVRCCRGRGTDDQTRVDTPLQRAKLKIRLSHGANARVPSRRLGKGEDAVQPNVTFPDLPTLCSQVGSYSRTGTQTRCTHRTNDERNGRRAKRKPSRSNVDSACSADPSCSTVRSPCTYEPRPLSGAHGGSRGCRRKKFCSSFV